MANLLVLVPALLMLATSTPTDVGDASRMKARLQRYCNFPPTGAVDEGVPPVPNATLRQVLINFRHGDRSAIHTLPLTSRESWECGRPLPADARWAASLLKPFHSSRECIVAGGPACDAREAELLDESYTTHARVAMAFRAWATTRTHGEPCGPTGGELSTTGWSQLLEIGYQLGERYSALLHADTPGSTALRVVSTDTGRTALSATAMTQGMLAGAAARSGLASGWLDDSDAETDGSITAVAVDSPGAASPLPPPRAWTEHAWEHRHRVPRLPQLHSLPLPLHVLARPDDPMMFAKGMRAEACPALNKRIRADPAAEAIVQAAFSLSSLPEELGARIAAVAGVRPRDVPGTEESADDILTRVCAGHALPCWRTSAPSSSSSSADNSTGSSSGSSSSHSSSSSIHRDGALSSSQPGDINEYTSSSSLAAVIEEDERAREAFRGLASSSLSCNEDGGDTAAGAVEVSRTLVENDVETTSGPSRGASTSSTAAVVVAAVPSTVSAAAPGHRARDPAVSCLSEADANTIITRADTHYANRYGSPHVRVLMYPLLADMVSQMDQATTLVRGGGGNAGNSVFSTTPPRVVLRAAHDTVIAPVAAVLGITDPLEPWPRYAARMALELWEGGSTDKAAEGAASGAHSHWYIRVVYNGVDRTRDMPCAEHVSSSSGASSGDAVVCTLPAFRGMVEALLHPYSSWEEACDA